tara:strand:+ start:968 stop:1864 length:897 start_codon:yes stop_codon:yes gene_type:complete
LRRFLVIILLCVFNFNLFSQDTLRTKVDKNFYKFLAAEGVVLSGAILYLKHEWYYDKKRVPFHFYNDFKGWNQVDKLGHFYVSYLESNVGYSILKKFNFSEKKALYFGGFQGLILETPIEFLDAYYQGWGFSVSDLVANTLGSVFFIMQQKIFNEQIIKPKLSFSKSIYASEANGLLGKKSLISQFVYDYNGYTYWFSFSPKKIFKFKKVPKWLNLAIGYGANGMLGEFENKSMYKGEEIPSFKRYRQFYLSLDIDFSKIRTKSRFVNKIFDGLSYIKIPLPTLELSNKKMKGYFFYF